MKHLLYEWGKCTASNMFISPSTMLHQFTQTIMKK
jgi:hypothetical protein